MICIKKIIVPYGILCIFLFAFLCSFNIFSVIGEERKDSPAYEIQIFYSGSQSGYLDPCG